MSTVWRPRQTIRPVAIGVIRRGAELLVFDVRNDAGAIIGWRPLGGSIEFGERAEQALRREIFEEVSEPVTEPRLIAVLENLYTHHDVRGHEIIFVFETAFANPETYRREQFDIKDAGAELTARWFDSARFREGCEQLPSGPPRISLKLRATDCRAGARCFDNTTLWVFHFACE